MIINDKRVQGFYIYNSDSKNIEFTKDDLVVSGNNIYVCEADIVSGIDPAEDTSYDYFRPYPGSKIISASEYFQWIKSSSSEEEEEGSDNIGNKYVSAQAIKGILQGYQFGLNMEGIISDWIDQNGDTTLRLSSITDRPIDNLMLTETLNRGMIKIDPRLKQISEDEDFSTLFGYLSKQDSETGNIIQYQIILSQYTYKQSSSSYIRVQEMMSPLSGVSVYRYMTWNDGEFPSNGSTISGWRNVFSYSAAIQSKLDALNDYYNRIQQQVIAQNSALSGSFRFREILGSTTEVSTTSVSRLSEGIYTICLEGFVDDGIYTESMTVRIKEGANYNVCPTKLKGKIKLFFDPYQSPGYEGSIEIIDDPTGTTKFLSVYKREEM